MEVAVLGLGVMGSALAANLLAAEHRVRVWNRTAAKAEPLIERGAARCASPAEAARGADVVISVVSDDEASRAVWLGRGGALDAAGPDAVLAECSTLSLAWGRELAARATERGLRLLDAPLSGTRAAAETGQLMVLVGGDAAALERARPALAAFGSEIIHFGPAGSGALFKFVNNLQSAIQLVALAEGLRLAEAGGIDLRLASRTLGAGRPGSPVVRGKAPRMVARDYQRVEFALRWMLKDVDYALAAADELGVSLDLLRAARSILGRAVDLGLGALDVSALAEAYR